MKVYSEAQEVIMRTQFFDPLLVYLTSKIVQIMKNKPRGRVLDIGCGTGRTSIALAQQGFNVVGVDINSRALKIAIAQAKYLHLDDSTEFRKVDLLKVKARTLGIFDYCVCSEVIEHVENYQKIIDIAHRSLKKGGSFILTTPHDAKQWTQLDDYADHIRRFAVHQLRLSLRYFENIDISTVGFPLFRILIWIYSHVIRLAGWSHRPGVFRTNTLFAWTYFLIGSLFLYVDSLFDRLGQGTTIVAVARKP